MQRPDIITEKGLALKSYVIFLGMFSTTIFKNFLYLILQNVLYLKVIQVLFEGAILCNQMVLEPIRSYIYNLKNLWL